MTAFNVIAHVSWGAAAVIVKQDGASQVEKYKNETLAVTTCAVKPLTCFNHH